MTTDLLANGLSAVFGTSTSVTSSHKVPFFNGTTPAGLATMSDLASVLGDQASLLNSALFTKQGLTSNSNIDNIGSGLYGGIGWIIDGVAVAGFLIAFQYSNYVAQVAILFSSTNPNIIKSRTYNNGWTAWKNL